MRFLVITRGPQGAGKTTFLNRNGLGLHALSMDGLRTLVSGPVLSRDGTYAINQEKNEYVVQLFRRLMEERMERGELLAIDATNQVNGDLMPIIELARKHRYRVAVADFSAVPRDILLANNAARPEHLQISEHVIDRARQRLSGQKPLPKFVRHIEWSPDGAHDRALAEFLDVPLVDLSSYDRIVHVGDIQGCFEPLAGVGGLLEKGLDPKAFYVFVGDFVDRGPQNAEVVAWALKHLVGRPNVVLLWGNHETHLHRYARGWPAVSEEFAQRTQPQLEAASLTPERVEPLVAALQELFAYTFRGQKVLVTHAGLPTVPPRLAAVSLAQLSKGTGFWEDPVDAQFDRQAPEGWVQVHGHRNHGWQPVAATARSFNLEDEVEKGGSLRAVVLDASGWTPVSVRNHHFLALRERLPKHHPSGVVPPWSSQPSNTIMDPQVLALMREHPGVKEKSSASAPHIASLNFSKQVFYNQGWDDVVVKARGLFFSTETGEIAARAYEKFFNIGERPETQLSALATGVSFPLTAYRKENGFLGIVGIDPKTRDLFLTSKSTPDSDFAGWFREIFDATVPAPQREAVRRWLVDHEASLAFEVIDPVRDPHMIEYPAPKLVLLDVFHRSTVPARLDHDTLQKFGERFGFEVKERAMVFKNASSFAGWYNVATRDLSYRYRGADIEGFVLEDQKGFQTKVKLPYYAFWKRMRGAKDRLARVRLRESEAAERGQRGRQEFEQAKRDRAGVLAKDPHPLAQAFLAWADLQPLEALGKDIIQLRTRFSQEVGIQPEWLAQPWMAFDPSEGEGLKAAPRKATP